MLPSLVRKAAGDAGFDLELGVERGWYRLGISGIPGTAWVRTHEAGVVLALTAATHLAEIDLPRIGVPLPTGAAGAVACESPGALFRSLRRARLLLTQSPPLPERELAQRLAAITGTEAQRMVKQRVGQALFREALLEYWEGRCAITGLDAVELLRASHAKPWKDATDTERLDVHNGLLLAVHLDALFDRGLLSFTDQGTALLRSDVTDGTLAALGLTAGVPPLRRVTDQHRYYLQYHRTHVWQE